MAAGRRRYEQYCGLARALDLVGERWTLLVVRELMAGPKRYSDLLGSLPGVGTSLLAKRLKTLEASGVVRRRELPPPVARTVYELTDTGRELADAMVPLALWGARHVLGSPGPEETFRTDWALLLVRALVDPAQTRDLVATYEFRVGDSVAHLVVDRGTMSVVSGPADRPDVVLITDLATFAEVGLGKVGAGSGRMQLRGDPDAVRTFLAVTRPVVEALAAP